MHLLPSDEKNKRWLHLKYPWIDLVLTAALWEVKDLEIIIVFMRGRFPDLLFERGNFYGFAGVAFIIDLEFGAHVSRVIALT